MAVEPEPSQCRQMLARRVAGVAFPAIAGMAQGQTAHERVARHLGHDRRRTDLRHRRVAADDTADRRRDVGCPVAVDQDQGRNHAQPLHRAPHGQHCGAQDVQPLDLGHRCRCQGNTAVTADDGCELRARGCGQGLGVGEAVDGTIENDRGHHHRSGQWPAPDLVHSDRRSRHGDNPPRHVADLTDHTDGGAVGFAGLVPSHLWSNVRIGDARPNLMPGYQAARRATPRPQPLPPPSRALTP